MASEIDCNSLSMGSGNYFIKFPEWLLSEGENVVLIDYLLYYLLILCQMLEVFPTRHIYNRPFCPYYSAQVTGSSFAMRSRGTYVVSLYSPIQLRCCRLIPCSPCQMFIGDLVGADSAETLNLFGTIVNIQIVPFKEIKYLFVRVTVIYRVTIHFTHKPDIVWVTLQFGILFNVFCHNFSSELLTVCLCVLKECISYQVFRRNGQSDAGVSKLEWTKFLSPAWLVACLLQVEQDAYVEAWDPRQTE
jgi:hypothetical protein